MSNFVEFYPVNGGMPDTAQRMYVASTNDAIAPVTASGYLTDKAGTTNNATGEFTANGPLQTGDILILKYNANSTVPNYTQGYVTNPSPGVYNFVQGIQGIATSPLLVAKKVVNGAIFPGGAPDQTITDAAILATDVVLPVVKTQTDDAPLLKCVPGAGSFAITFAVDPGAGTLDYVVFATV